MEITLLPGNSGQVLFYNRKTTYKTESVKLFLSSVKNRLITTAEWNSARNQRKDRESQSECSLLTAQILDAYQ